MQEAVIKKSDILKGEIIGKISEIPISMKLSGLET